jgi:DNA-directed RNA polymerase beta' subunit
MSVFGFINDYIQKQKLPDQQSLRQQLQHIHRQDQQLLLQSPEAHGGHLAAALLRPEQQLLQNDLERKSHDSLGIAGGIGLGLGGLARMPKRQGNDGAPSSSDLASAGLVLSNDLSVRKEYVPQPSVLPSIEPSLANPNKFRKINISAYDKPNDAPRGKITACSICLWNPDHILRTSVCEVLHTNANDKGRPKHGSLMDLRMGPVDSLFKCMTCGSPSTSCMGHFGHITLAMPVYHISYMKTILYLLQCFCHGCSTFLMSPSDARFDKIMALPPIKRGREFAKIITESVLTCPNAKCGLPQRVYMQQKAAIHCYLRNPKPVRRTKKDMIAAPVLGASVSKKKNGKTSLKKSAAGVVGGRQDDSYVPAIGAGKTASESKRSAVVAMDESSSSSSGEESSSDGDGEDGEIDDGYVAHRHATDDDDDDEEEEDENENEDDLDKSDSDDTDTDQRSKKRERHHDVDSDASSSDDDDDDDDDRGDNKSYAGRDRDKLRAGRRDKEQDSESDSDEYRLRDMQQEEEDEEAEADLNDDVHDEEDMDYVEAAGGGEDPEDLQDEAEEDDDGDKEDGEEKDGGGDHDRDEDDEDVDGRIRGLRKLMMGSDGIYADGGHFGDTADDDIKTKRGAAGVAGRGASSSYDRSAQLVSAKFIRAQTKKRCGESVPFTPNCALGILRHIAPTDYDKVGFTAGSTRPHYTIIQHLPVPPPCVRVMIGTNQMGKTRIEYDAGRHLKSVITCNNQLRSKKMTLEEAAAGAVTKTPDELTKIRSYTRQEYDKLQKLIAQHIDKVVASSSRSRVSLYYICIVCVSLCTCSGCNGSRSNGWSWQAKHSVDSVSSCRQDWPLPRWHGL